MIIKKTYATNEFSYAFKTLVQINLFRCPSIGDKMQDHTTFAMIVTINPNKLKAHKHDFLGLKLGLWLKTLIYNWVSIVNM